MFLDVVVNFGELWFVNFYFLGCSYCYDLVFIVRMFNNLVIKVFFLVDVLCVFFFFIIVCWKLFCVSN